MKLGGSILVAEDNKSNQLLITLLLEDMNIDVTFANNGEEAVTLYEKSISSKEKFSLILMDSNMPVMGGIEATQSIKALNGYYETPSSCINCKCS